MICLTRREVYHLFLVTLGVMLVNYISYYADDLIFFYQSNPHQTALTVFFQILAFPVTIYVEMFEKKYFLAVPILGRAVNYTIESTYFFILISTSYLLSRSIWRVLKKSR